MDNLRMQPKQNVKLTEYEKNQEFNAVTSWMHSFRYRHIVTIFSELSVQLNRPIKVFEIGAGSGKLFSVLNPRFKVEYVGVELQPNRVEVAKERYQHYSNFSMICGRAEEHVDTIGATDVIVALETLEHIPENIVVRIVEAISANKPKIFICSVPVEVGPIIWVKNVGSFFMGYKRYKSYTWQETFWAGLYQLDKLRPRLYAGHRGFDWRWLAQTISHNMRIVEIRALPITFLPLSLSPSVMFIAKPRE